MKLDLRNWHTSKIVFCAVSSGTYSSFRALDLGNGTPNIYIYIYTRIFARATRALDSLHFALMWDTKLWLGSTRASCRNDVSSPIHEKVLTVLRDSRTDGIPRTTHTTPHKDAQHATIYRSHAPLIEVIADVLYTHYATHTEHHWTCMRTTQSDKYAAHLIKQHIKEM